jgi:membrane protease subunit HflK
MAWNEPGKSGGSGNGGNQGGSGGGPPDLDQLLKRLRERIRGLGRNGHGGSGSPGGGGRGSGIVLVIIPIVIAIWLATGLYIVDPGEKAVILHFGKYSRTVGPGWHWRLPYPIGQVLKVDTQQVLRASNRAVMLTKDENIVDVEISVQYRIDNAMNYLFQLKNPKQTVEQLLRSAVRQVVGTSKMNQVIQEGVKPNELNKQTLAHVNLKKGTGEPAPKNGLKGINKKLAGQIEKKKNEFPKITERSRAQLPSNVRRIMQFILDKYDSGIRLVAVNVQYAQPPDPVQEAFQKAIEAREQEERSKNIARAYARKILARAQGQKAQILAESKGYKQRKINHAKGQANRFSELLQQYEKAPGITHERLYLETMENVLSSTHLMLNNGGSNTMTFLPLDKILQRAKKSQNAQQSSGGGNNTGQSSHQQTLPSPSQSGHNSSSSNARSSVQELRSRSSHS